MKLFSGKKKDPPPRVQIRSVQSHPFNLIDGYVPLGGGEIMLYRQISRRRCDHEAYPAHRRLYAFLPR